MNGVPPSFGKVLDRAEFKRPPHRAGVELYRAHIVQHAFEPHTHEAYGLGVIEAGVERFRYRGSEHLAPAGSLVLMNPDELHTGRAETAPGWRYRMLYLDRAVLDDLSGEPGWWFADAVAHDPQRATRARAALVALWSAEEPLAFDSALATLIVELRPTARVPMPLRSEALHRFAPVLDHMHAHLGDAVTLDALAQVAGLSPFHFLREFKRAEHATPHEMLMALRLFDAKRRLAVGEAPAQIAAAVGLTDQAHLTRAFARRYGVTPGRYQQQLGTRPARRA